MEARDKSEDKVTLMQENIDRLGIINMVAALQDATVFDQNSFHRADIVLCDVPCSGLGVIGRKQDIRYRMNPTRQEELVRIQRRILSVAQNYVKPGGVLIYSTCTIGADENQMNLKYFLENFPFRLDTIDGQVEYELRAGTQPDTRIRLRGKGVPLPRRNERGDHYVTFTVGVPDHLNKEQKEALLAFDAAGGGTLSKPEKKKKGLFK